MEAVEGTLVTPDGYWRVEVIRYGRTERWYRVLHASTVVGDRLPIAAVERILGDAYATLQPVEARDEGGVA
jgi:hypothetical protein